MKDRQISEATRRRVCEAKKVVVYKKLLQLFGEFCDRSPATSVERLFTILAEKGAAILPTDKRALAILNRYASFESVQNLLNHRFSDLPAELKPVTKSGNRHELALWCIDKQVFDKVRDLLDFEEGKKGFWSDVDCKKVTLLDTDFSSD